MSLASTVWAVDILGELEADAIRQALAASGGNVSEAARLLGLHRQSLQRKMRRLGVCTPNAVAADNATISRGDSA